MSPRYPGVPAAEDGSTAVVHVETAASDAAGAYPITPSTQMGEGWAAATAAGQTNVNGHRLIFFEPEGEHAAAAVTAGLSMTGLRATNFSSGQGLAYMHESLYAAAGKRLTYVLNVAARAMTKQALNVHAGHDDYHAVDDSGFFQLFGKNVQHIADLTAIAHRIAELALTPGLCAQDGFLTSHMIESVRLPERELIKEYLGDPADTIETPTPAQRLVFGPTRRRIPELFDLDYPAILGPVQNQDSYAQGVAAQRPFYFDHVAELADRAMDEYFELTGRRYARAIGYRLEDADYVIAGQGSVISTAEAVGDYLRERRDLKVGVLNLVMFRPFPADLVTRLLKGKRAVTVLERVDQPLAVDLPLLREIRAAMTKGLENAAGDGTAHEGVEPLGAHQIPSFFSGGFGFGSRDLQPSDIIAAVENMLEPSRGRRHFYLGFDFIRDSSGAAQLSEWQDELVREYPGLQSLGLTSEERPNLLPEGAISLRMHSVGGWGAITTGKNLVMTTFDLLGLNVQANPKYGSEKKGQPTTFFATLSPEPVRSNAELKRVDVVLSPDPNVFGHSDPLAGLVEEGTFVIQSELSGEEFWLSLPETAKRTIREKRIRLYTIDGFRIAGDEASSVDLRYRMQGAAFMGAFFAVSPLLERHGLDRERLFEGIRGQLQRKFGKLGHRVVEDNLRVIARGFDEIQAIKVPAAAPVELPVLAPRREPVLAGARMPAGMDYGTAQPGLANARRFFEQVCGVCATGEDPIADPFAATSVIPAASSTTRDMTSVRFEVPHFIPSKCTGCAQCWTQCPDSAIPGLVSSVEDLLATALDEIGEQASGGGLRDIIPNLAEAVRARLRGGPFTTFGEALATAYSGLDTGLSQEDGGRTACDAEFGAVHARLADFPLAKTVPFFDLPERRGEGDGGLLSITVNPSACKGCNICVEVCPEDALITVRQDPATVDRLRENWDLWEKLPDTEDRFINVSNLEEGIGVLPTLLLKKDIYRSMLGGDGACMGCGEKTSLHLVTSTVEAMMQPRVREFVTELESLVDRLRERGRQLLAAGTDPDTAASLADGEALSISVDPTARDEIGRLAKTRKALEDLRWRYLEGPSGRGRAALGMANSTGCSSVWGSTFPYNPYPYPWVNHLFQDSPSIAIGIFEGHMRKMADAFAAVRRARLYLDGTYDAAEHEPFFEAFDWRQFDDTEFGLCPPILAIGGDGAMFDIGFQNLSRLLASGKPIRVIVVDTQVYSNTGGQACTSGFLGQVSDMAAYGAASHGKEETRKEISLIAMAHRGAFVAQTSQASPPHLISSMLQALQTRRPALVNIYTPCPVEHGLADDWAPHAAKLALESRAFPFLAFDPDAGSAFADCLNLEGNPSLDQRWPLRELEYRDESGEARRMELPLTIADWAATEGRFRRHFRELRNDAPDAGLLRFDEYIEAPPEVRAGKTPFIYTLDDNGTLKRLAVSTEIVDLAEDRLLLWSQLKQLAGLEVPSVAFRTVEAQLSERFAEEAGQLKAEYEAKLSELKASYPRLVARRLAEGLLRANDGSRGGSPSPGPAGAAARGSAPAVPAPAASGAPPTSTAGLSAPVGAPPPAGNNGASEEPAPPAAGPTIDSELCTTCEECVNINRRMFAYNESKQAYIKDATAGTYKELVTAAERCTARIIHPGAPLNPGEPDLEKWVKRAEPFNLQPVI